MKKWNAPEVNELNINETAHRFFGKYNDGGYVGDGILSGHSTNTKPAEPNQTVPTNPTDSTEQLS